MSDSKQTIDVSKIMEEIRQEIKDKRYKNEDISFTDLPLSDIHASMAHSEVFFENLRALREWNNVHAQRELKSNRVFGPLILFFKKIIRKCMAFYIEPIVADQNTVNSLSAACIVELCIIIESMRKHIERLEKMNERPGPEK